MSKGLILLCAGGTGGHLFPAESLAHELNARGFEVHLATDDRAQRFAAAFPAKKIHIVKSATPNFRNPVALAKASLTLLQGYREARKLVAGLSPRVVVGFGGYPTLPPMWAANRLGIPTVIHDANAVMGRANRLLARRARTIAMGFGGAAKGERVIVTGNPVRPGVLAAAKSGYPLRQADEPFNLLVFGGSQGAQFFSQAMPEAMSHLSPAQRRLFRIVQQARPEDEAGLRNAYAGIGIAAEIAPFFANMAERIAQAHFVISRAGASTVSELAVIGRPCLLVPYPHALDHDQAMNARTLAEGGGARIIEQSELSASRLASILGKSLAEPGGLAEMAEKAKRSGKPDAAALLAECVEKAIIA